MNSLTRRALDSMQLGCYDEAAQFCMEALQRAPADDRALHILGVIAIQQGRLTEALDYFMTAHNINASDSGHCLNLGNVHRALGNPAEAIRAYRRALDNDPDNLAAWNGWAYTSMPGAPYLSLLRQFHEWLRPAVYLEIGVESGRTLALARPPTRAVGVDPQPAIEYEFPAETSIFECTSDEYFAANDIRDDIGPVDLAFLDGLHLFEQTLRDFRHVEKQASRKAVVLIHDCLPLNGLMAGTDRKTRFWTGDTWKIIPALRQFRPDLQVFTIATPPTGLGVVTRLDPESDGLERNWNEILSEWLSRKLPDDTDARRTELAIVDNDFELTRRRIETALAAEDPASDT